MARSAVRLPPDVGEPFEVYVNGVPQREGTDFRRRGDLLVFDRELVREGRLGFWRWTLGAIGIGTYRDDHSVDIRHTLPDGRPMVAQGLAIERVE